MPSSILSGLVVFGVGSGGRATFNVDSPSVMIQLHFVSSTLENVSLRTITPCLPASTHCKLLLTSPHHDYYRFPFRYMQLFNRYQIFSAGKYPKGILIKPLLETLKKNIFCKTFSKVFVKKISPKNRFEHAKRFFQAENTFESLGRFDQIKNLSVAQCRKKLSSVPQDQNN